MRCFCSGRDWKAPRRRDVDATANMHAWAERRNAQSTRAKSGWDVSEKFGRGKVKRGRSRGTGWLIDSTRRKWRRDASPRRQRVSRSSHHPPTNQRLRVHRIIISVSDRDMHLDCPGSEKNAKNSCELFAGTRGETRRGLCFAFGVGRAVRFGKVGGAASGGVWTWALSYSCRVCPITDWSGRVLACAPPRLA